MALKELEALEELASEDNSSNAAVVAFRHHIAVPHMHMRAPLPVHDSVTKRRLWQFRTAEQHSMGQGEKKLGPQGADTLKERKKSTVLRRSLYSAQEEVT